MQQDPSNTFIAKWECQRDAPPSSEAIDALLAPRPFWAWRWSPWLGVTYGLIPVSKIIAIALFLALWR